MQVTIKHEGTLTPVPVTSISNATMSEAEWRACELKVTVGEAGEYVKRKQQLMEATKHKGNIFAPPMTCKRYMSGFLFVDLVSVYQCGY